MAIYSCNLKSIGRTTHLPGTAGAHIRYIARPQAQPVILAGHMPSDPAAARNWIDRAERASRKNARVLDKIRIALPRELDEAQRVQLIRDFMLELTGGRRVPWFAAIHQKGDDSHNPHVHIDIHDRGMDTGKRVLRLSDSTRDRLKAGLPGPKAVEWIRDRWEVVCNRALEQAGHEARIDRRTLAAQGIDRAPTIHEGPRASHINDHVRRPRSKRRTNGAGRVIDYPAIDKGKTRREFNAHIIDLNLERALRAGHPETAAWAQFEKEQAEMDRALERQLKAERRARTKEMRAASARYTAQRRQLRTQRRDKAQQAQEQVQDRFRKRRDAMRQEHAHQREALRKKQKGLMARIARKLSRQVRARHHETRVRMVEDHRQQRRLMSEAYRRARQQAKDALAVRYTTKIEEIDAGRAADLAALEVRHAEAEAIADVLRQQREADREQQRSLTATRIADWKTQRTAGQGDPIKSEAIARAIARVKEKEEEERKAKGRERERGR